MLFFIQSAILCALFSLAIYLRVRQDPIKVVLSYPTPIRKRVESLPQHRNAAIQSEQRHLGMKIGAVLVFVVLLTALLWFSGMRQFVSALLYSFALLMVVNLWDLVVLDWGWFCHAKRFRIPGTEDMDKEYRDPWFHFRAFLVGCGICFVVSGLAAGAVAAMAAL